MSWKNVEKRPLQALVVLGLLCAAAGPASADDQVNGQLIAGITGFTLSAAAGATGIASAFQVKSAQNTIDPVRVGKPRSVDVCAESFATTHHIAAACSKGSVFQTVEIVSFAASALLLGAGVYLVVASARPGSKQPGAWLAPSVGLGRAGVDLTVRF